MTVPKSHSPRSNEVHPIREIMRLLARKIVEHLVNRPQLDNQSNDDTKKSSRSAEETRK
jgi:hypothetical protein